MPEPSCTKLKFLSARQARRHAKKAIKRNGGPGNLSPYRCPFCGWWHLTTHIKPSRRRRKMKRNYTWDGKIRKWRETGKKKSIEALIHDGCWAIDAGESTSVLLCFVPMMSDAKNNPPTFKKNLHLMGVLCPGKLWGVFHSWGQWTCEIWCRKNSERIFRSINPHFDGLNRPMVGLHGEILHSPPKNGAVAAEGAATVSTA